MASIRRTLSPVPRARTSLNGEACSVASPLSKSSSCTQNYPPQSGGFFSLCGSSDSHPAFYRTQSLFLGVFSQRSSRPLERSKSKGQTWRRPLLHFFICFMLGILIGLTQFVPKMNLAMILMSKHRSFSFEVIPPIENIKFHGISLRNVTPLRDSLVMKSNATVLEPDAKEIEQMEGVSDDILETKPLIQDSDLVVRKLLIIVTITYARPFQVYYLNRLAHTLELVPPPLLWIVVEMTSQSAEIADILRRTGVMYRHLVCKKNLTEIKDRGTHLRNVALSHIETHRLDGIVYFADDNNIYSIDLFKQMRQIRQFGTWAVAKLTESKIKAIIEGPVCNGTQVIGWHTNKMTRRFWRFHAEMSGFAFNSTIVWDPKRWHRHTLEPIRHLETVDEGFQASTFIEQVVEDESQMEGLPQDCSKIMVWHLPLESPHSFYPRKWSMKDNLDVITPLA